MQQVRLRYGLRSFCYEAARIWYSLPNSMRLAKSYPQFRTLLHTWVGHINFANVRQVPFKIGSILVSFSNQALSISFV